MKKIVLLLSLISISFSTELCENTSPVLSREEGLLLAKRKNCMVCHDLNSKKIGPAFTDIAKAYAGKKDIVDYTGYAYRRDVVEYLAKRIKKGSQNVWGPVPMPAQNISSTEAKMLARWILELNQ